MGKKFDRYLEGRDLPQEGPADTVDLAAAKIDDLVVALADIDDIELLELTLQAEEAGQDRAGAKAAIEGRIAELRADDSQE